MAYLEWSSELNTGIGIIDSQHQRIVEYINMLHVAIGTKNPKQVGEVLDELVDYTMSHFAFEESLMEQAGYPFLVAHKRVHALFSKRVNEFQSRFNLGEDVSEELLSTLTRWLVNHIRRDDADYAPVVKQGMGAEVKPEAENRDGWLARSLKKFFR